MLIASRRKTIHRIFAQNLRRIYMEELGFDNIMSDFEMAGLFGGSDGEQPAVVK